MTRQPLVHIGYHKTGTTWFQDLVFNNAALGFASPMTLRDTMNTVVFPNDLDYQPEATRALFDQAIMNVADKSLVPVFSQERFSGHPHSGGYDSKLMAERLAGIFDQARVLIVIREQKAIILASYNQHVRRGGGVSLRTYISNRDRLFIPSFDYAHFKYHRLIQLYYRLFGTENVLVLPYEMFVRTPAEFTTKVFEHAGISDVQQRVSTLDFTRKVNESLSPFEVQAYRRINFFFARRNPINLYSLFPGSGAALTALYSAAHAVDRVLPASYGQRTKANWQRYLASQTKDMYRESNQITSDLIQHDLGKWGYDI